MTDEETIEIRHGGAIISDQCVENHGEDGALEQGLDVVRERYRELRDYWVGKGAKVHLRVVLERPEEIPDDGGGSDA